MEALSGKINGSAKVLPSEILRGIWTLLYPRFLFGGNHSAGYARFQQSGVVGIKRDWLQDKKFFLQKRLAVGRTIEYNKQELDWGQRRPRGVFCILADAFLLSRGRRNPLCDGTRKSTRKIPPFSPFYPVIDGRKPAAGRLRGMRFVNGKTEKGVLNHVYRIGLFRHGSFPGKF